MKPGDLVLIRFPRTDLRAGKLRPALIVAVTPGHYVDLLLALVSSRTYQAIAGFDEIIDPSDPDYTSSGLKVRSVIRLTRLATVESAVANARLGTISLERLQRIRAKLADWLAEGTDNRSVG
ncbi:MAG: type II toxin-antitoxin system PemK/MazF family toxin [Anaerolineae bacterium]